MSIFSPRDRSMIADGVLDHVQVPEAEEVHLQQADLLDRPHRVLGHRLVGALRLPVRGAIAVPIPGAIPRTAVLGELQRHDLLQRPVGDHHCRGVDRVVADDPLEALGGVEDLLGVRVGVVGALQLLTGLQALLEARAPAEDRLGDLLGQAVAGRVVVAEDPRRVTDRGSRRHLAEGDDLGHAIAAVLVGDVADHPLAAADREVDVDVGHGLAAGVEEALEEQAVGERVEVGDLQRVGDDRAGGRPAAGTHRDPLLLGVADEVPDDQEVGLEAHLRDHPELEVETLPRLGRDRVSVAAAQPLGRELAEHLARLGALGRREARQQQLAELDLHLAALGDLERGGDRLRHVREGLGHLVGALQIELVGVEAKLRLLDRRLRLDAEQRRVRVVVLAAQVVHVGGRDQWPAELLRRADDSLVRLLLLRDSVALHLEVDLLGAEGLDQVIDMRAGVGRTVLHQAAAEARLQAPGEGEDSLRVSGEELHVDVGLAAGEALEEAGGAEPDEVAEAGVARGQQGEMVPLVARLGRRQVAVVDEVGLEADDRLHPRRDARLVVLDRAVHHAVIGETEGGHLELRGACGQRVDLARAVEQRVLAVDVQVDRSSAHPSIMPVRADVGPTKQAPNGR